MGHHLPLYILAGGQSRRFGSDKARAVLDGRPLLERIANQLMPTADGVWAVADQADKYADLEIATIADAQPHLGPVNGLVTLLQHRLERGGKGWAVVSPCDLVEPAPYWVDPLIEAAPTTSAKTAPAVAYRESSGRWQPLPCLVHTDMLGAARDAAAAGRLSLWRLLESVRATPVPLPAGRSAVPSANTPEQLHRRPICPES